MFRLVNISETIGYGFDMMNEWRNITGNKVDFESDLCTSCVTFWLPSNRANDRVNDRVNDTEIYDILSFCMEPRSRRDILSLLGLAYHSDAFKKHIKPLIDKGFLVPTISEKPSSRLQKYKLTELGKGFLVPKI